MPFGKTNKEAAARPDFGPVLDVLSEGGVLAGAPHDDSPEGMASFVSSYHRAQELLDWKLLGCGDSRAVSDTYRSRQMVCSVLRMPAMPDTLVDPVPG